VAISDLILAEESLRDGVLVQPFPATVEEGIGYYLVYPPERARQPKIRVLREWMLGSAQGPAPGGPATMGPLTIPSRTRSMT